MALETGTYIDDLNVNNPASTDGLGQADDHMRLIKSTIKSTFPSITGAVSSTHTELNKMDGSTTRVAATLVDGDGVVVNDGGTMKQVLASSLKTYMAVPDSITDLGITDGSAGEYLVTDGAGNFSFDVPVSGLSFNTSNGVLTATRGGGLGNLTVDLDGRFLTAHPNISAASSDNNSGSTFVQDVILDSNGHVTGLTSVDVNTTGAGKFTRGATGVTTQSFAVTSGMYMIQLFSTSTQSGGVFTLPTTNLEFGMINKIMTSTSTANAEGQCFVYNGTDWRMNHGTVAQTQIIIANSTSGTSNVSSAWGFLSFNGAATLTSTSYAKFNIVKVA